MFCSNSHVLDVLNFPPFCRVIFDMIVSSRRIACYNLGIVALAAILIGVYLYQYQSNLIQGSATVTASATAIRIQLPIIRTSRTGIVSFLFEFTFLSRCSLIEQGWNGRERNYLWIESATAFFLAGLAGDDRFFLLQRICALT